MIGLYKTELVKNLGTWKSCEQLNLKTAEWVHWFNTKCISGHNGFGSPAFVEEIWYSSGVDTRKPAAGL